MATVHVNRLHLEELLPEICDQFAITRRSHDAVVIGVAGTGRDRTRETESGDEGREAQPLLGDFAMALRELGEGVSHMQQLIRATLQGGSMRSTPGAEPLCRARKGRGERA